MIPVIVCNLLYLHRSYFSDHIIHHSARLHDNQHIVKVREPF